MATLFCRKRAVLNAWRTWRWEGGKPRWREKCADCSDSQLTSWKKPKELEILLNGRKWLQFLSIYCFFLCSRNIEKRTLRCRSAPSHYFFITQLYWPSKEKGGWANGILGYRHNKVVSLLCRKIVYTTCGRNWWLAEHSSISGSTMSNQNLLEQIQSEINGI